MGSRKGAWCACSVHGGDGDVDDDDEIIFLNIGIMTIFFH